MREGLGSIPLLSCKGSCLLAFFYCFILFGSASVILLCLSTTFSNDLGTKLTAIWDLGVFPGRDGLAWGLFLKKRASICEEICMRRRSILSNHYIFTSSPPHTPLFYATGREFCRVDDEDDDDVILDYYPRSFFGTQHQQQQQCG